MTVDDKRLIEDYLPIEAISAEASREKSVRKGHISTLHLWWARRPLVACRAVVYGALVPASQFVPENATDEKKKSLGRANAAKFVTALCKYPGDSNIIADAQSHILDAHADRLSKEIAEWKAGKTDKPTWIDEFKFSGKKVAAADIAEGRAPRPRVLDMFAGGGAIPLEALRLGCEAYANDLNPVAHIIQLCTLVYPQKYGKPDPTVRGMTGQKDKEGNTTWGGLADEVRYWGNWVMKKVKAEIGDIYPLIPDPEYKGERPPIEFDKESGEWIVSRKGARKRKGQDDPFAPPQPVMEFAEDAQLRLSPSAIDHEPSTIPPGYLMPVAYLWTRTVKCKNPACGATVPLVKQTWLCKKEGRQIAMKMIAPKGKKVVRFEVVEAQADKGLGFDPEAFSKAGNATCPFCPTVADSDYVKAEACAKRMGEQLMAIVCARPDARGKVYLAASDVCNAAPDNEAIGKQIDELCKRWDLTVPDEVLEANPRSFDVQHFGFVKWRDVHLPRQLLAMLAHSAIARHVFTLINNLERDREHAKAVLCCLSMMVARLGNQCSSLCRWQPEFVAGMLGDAGLPMFVDFAEINAMADSSGGWPNSMRFVLSAIEGCCESGQPAIVLRGSALKLPITDCSCDGVITDPPYYDGSSPEKLNAF